MYIDCQHLKIQFPIYNAQQRSIKRSLLTIAGGGRLSQSQGVTMVTALDDISFSLQDGDRLALLGHNGSGKTTLLRALAGVYSPVSGTLKTSGKISSLLDATLGMEPELTGIENIKLRSLLLGIPPQQLPSLIDDVIAFSELEEFIYLPVRTYSSGMILRLAFAICTARAPEILLMDEWISVGDAAFKDKAEKRLQSFIDKAAILVIATHDPHLANRVSNQQLHLEQGKIL
ncbi:ABC transporter ATP-binding protein [Rosenbergiella australiborealis]|uniref:ABC transporter ATP-binding protein n=1 Tax=Rosenbergiella australiborealis TaxID=1544696 RepID=A0ABS5T5S4_9GAMM|nr:ABC transporter ATP-binding protein [Rosenbergiella australiborealis]MBT0726870.1 ABC transporter ATP-binding protein [Rosenbergiella australiborealis]